MVIGEAGYFFAYHSDTVAQQSRNWQARFRRMNNLRRCSVVPTKCWNRPRLPIMCRFSDVPARADDVRSLGASRHCGCEHSRSDFDPLAHGGGWSNLWMIFPADRWAWFIRKKLKLNPKSPPGLKRWNSPNLPARAGPIHVCFRGNSGRRISSW